MEYLIDNDLKEKGEYQLTNATENMKQKAQVLSWRSGRMVGLR
ncbi:MAG: hypothetical protein R2728_01255 [Chitinophagales bacterium]